MAKRKPKPDPVVDLPAAEAEAHARAAHVTDPAAFEFPLPDSATVEAAIADAAASWADPLTPRAPVPAEALPTPTVATESVQPSGGPALESEGKERKAVFGLRGDYEAGVKLLEDRRFKQMQLRFAAKPSDAVRQMVREAGFQWRSQEQAWTRQIDAEHGWRTRTEADALFDRVATLIREERGLAPAQNTGHQPG